MMPHSTADDFALLLMRHILFVMAVMGCFCLLLGFSYTESRAAAPDSRYAELKISMEHLKTDARRAAWREPWQKLAQEFTALAKQHARWKNAAAAAFRAAQCHEELAARSFTKADRLRAAQGYTGVADSYPHSVLADDALLAAARLYAGPLKNTSMACTLLDRVERDYARGDMRAAAKALRARCGGGSVGEIDSKAAGKNSGARGGAAPVGSAAQTRTFRPVSQDALADMGAQLGLGVRTVFIDAGHGGSDPGAVHNGVREESVTLDIAKELGAVLRSSGLRVLHSRTTDKGLSLAGRTALANKAGADIFVSLHVNASNQCSASGLETYFLDLARDKRAVQVAMRENNDSGRGLGEINSVMARVMLRARTMESGTLAADIQRQAARHIREGGYPLKDGGSRSAPFWVLMDASMPSVLIEVGYNSNAAEAARLKTPAYCRRMAEGVARGILRYKNRMENTTRAALNLTDGGVGAM